MEENGILRCSEAHWDAHEFFIFLLKNIIEEITVLWNNAQSFF